MITTHTNITLGQGHGRELKIEVMHSVKADSMGNRGDSKIDYIVLLKADETCLG